MKVFLVIMTAIALVEAGKDTNETSEVGKNNLKVKDENKPCCECKINDLVTWFGHKFLEILVVAFVSSIVLPTAINLLVCLCGFATSGVRSESCASHLQSFYGDVPANSGFSRSQSFMVTGGASICGCAGYISAIIGATVYAYLLWSGIIGGKCCGVGCELILKTMNNATD